MFVQFTIFEDSTLSAVREHGELNGMEGKKYFEALRNLKGSEPKERDVIFGVRIDRIGSEEASY